MCCSVAKPNIWQLVTCNKFTCCTYRISLLMRGIYITSLKQCCPGITGLSDPTMTCIQYTRKTHAHLPCVMTSCTIYVCTCMYCIFHFYIYTMHSFKLTHYSVIIIIATVLYWISYACMWTSTYIMHICNGPFKFWCNAQCVVAMIFVFVFQDHQISCLLMLLS